MTFLLGNLAGGIASGYNMGSYAQLLQGRDRRIQSQVDKSEKDEADFTKIVQDAAGAAKQRLLVPQQAALQQVPNIPAADTAEAPTLSPVDMGPQAKPQTLGVTDTRTARLPARPPMPIPRLPSSNSVVSPVMAEQQPDQPVGMTLPPNAARIAAEGVTQPQQQPQAATYRQPTLQDHLAHADDLYDRLIQGGLIDKAATVGRQRAAMAGDLVKSQLDQRKVLASQVQSGMLIGNTNAIKGAMNELGNGLHSDFQNIDDIQMVPGEDGDPPNYQLMVGGTTHNMTPQDMYQYALMHSDPKEAQDMVEKRNKSAVDSAEKEQDRVINRDKNVEQVRHNKEMEGINRNKDGRGGDAGNNVLGSHEDEYGNKQPFSFDKRTGRATPIDLKNPGNPNQAYIDGLQDGTAALPQGTRKYLGTSNGKMVFEGMSGKQVTSKD